MNSLIIDVFNFMSLPFKIGLFSILLWLGCLSYITGQSIIIDHRHVEDFDRIPALYKEKAEQTRMLFMDRSVGANISQALDCLASDWSVARSYCKRWEHRDTTYNVDPKEVFWSGIWDRTAWRYEFWPANC